MIGSIDCEPDSLSLPDETAAASEDLADLPSDEEISSYEQDQNSEREDLPNQSSKNVAAAQEKQEVQFKNSDLLNDPPDVQLSTNPTPPSSPTWFAADNIQYERVITYLHTGKHIAGLTNAERLKIWRQSTIFQWDSTQEVLYYTRRKDGIRRQVVRSPDERNRVLHLYHGNPTGGGHSGWNATYEKVSKNYFWRKMQDDVKHYVATCNKCQRYTPLKTQAHTMTPIKVKEPWSRHDRWGPPGRILTDQGPEFCSLASEDLADLPSDEEISSYEQDQNSEREDLPNQ
ncbi:Gypsy retrotransposon integrase-like protein 1-like 8, partial [Homarus americanus]